MAERSVKFTKVIRIRILAKVIPPSSRRIGFAFSVCICIIKLFRIISNAHLVLDL